MVSGLAVLPRQIAHAVPSQKAYIAASKPLVLSRFG